MMVITNSAAANAKQLKKDSERWGELPTGSRAELVSDIARILDEAITNIDDVSARDERNPLIAKSLRKLAQTVNSIMAQLKPLPRKRRADGGNCKLRTIERRRAINPRSRDEIPPECREESKEEQVSTARRARGTRGINLTCSCLEGALGIEQVPDGLPPLVCG